MLTAACAPAGCQVFRRADAADYLRCPRRMVTLMAAGNLPDPDAEAAQYRLHCNDVNYAAYRRLVAKLIDPFVRALAPGARGLDFGCGPGQVRAAMLREQGFAITEFDLLCAPHPAALAETYDFFFCGEVFEHFHLISRELGTLDSLVRPGGVVAVMTGFERPDRDFPTWHCRRDPTNVAFYRSATFKCFARDRGWSVSFPADDVALMKKPAQT